MQKKWEIQNGKIGNDIIKQNPDINPVILEILAKRGFSGERIRKFLEPDYKENLHDPFLFKDMNPAVELINKHLQSNSRVIIYGDYDADGITASAVMLKTLEFLGGKNLDVYLPDRETEGYGLKKEAIDQLAKEGTNLIITVDNAIRNTEEVNYAKELGMDIIITDHHEPGDELPDCLILNPKVKSEKYPFKELAGVGVAFKLAQAFLRTDMKNTKSHEIKIEAFEKWLLDLVAIGTVADLVPLVDENRILVKYGLIVLNKTRRMGLKKIIEVAQSNIDKKGNKKEIDNWQVGFQLAPRLNAAGRLDHANSAYQLLITEDKQQAVKIARELNSTNQERQKITEDIFAQADQNIKEQDKIIFAVAPFLLKEGIRDGYKKDRSNSKDNSQKKHQGIEAISNPLWPSGIMGLVAGKLTEKYYRPALAVTKKKDEIVGSGRSIPEFNITAMLEECAEYLSAFGGHKQACGFTVKSDMLDIFLAKSKEIADQKLKEVELAPVLEIDMEVSIKDVNENLYKTLRKLRPFGIANPQPKFVSRNLRVADVFKMGGEEQHLKLKLQSEDKIIFNAVAFNALDEWKEIKIRDMIDVVYYIDMNEWNGRREVQLKIIDIKS